MCCSFYKYLPMTASGPSGYQGITWWCMCFVNFVKWQDQEEISFNMWNWDSIGEGGGVCCRPNLYKLKIYIVASHLQRGSVVTVAVGQINGALSDCGPPTMQDKHPYPIQIHLIDTRILDLEWAATIYRTKALCQNSLQPTRIECFIICVNCRRQSLPF